LVLTSTAAMIEELGHAPIAVEDAFQALAQLREAPPPDLVITDYGMPGMSGLELAQALRTLRPGLPILLATGYGDLPAGAASSLTRLSKPFDPPALAAAIKLAGEAALAVRG
jgi:CheY-like chemotaxis protein